MKYLDFIYCFFVSDEPFDGWFGELYVAAIQLVFINCLAFVFSVPFRQPIAFYITATVVTTLFASCKIRRWIRECDKKQTLELISNGSEITFAQALANPEMAKDLIAGYKLEPDHRGGGDYIARILSNDLDFLWEIGSVSSQWLAWIGYYLAKDDLHNWRPAKRFIEFSSRMPWKMTMECLNNPRLHPEKYLHCKHPSIVWYWNAVRAVKSYHCQTEPENCDKILASEPRNYLDVEYLLAIVQANHECAMPLAEFEPKTAVAVAQIAPEHALEIAKALPGKAVEIAAVVPQAFK